MTVLITGATGTTGGLVLGQLRTAGIPVRALTRSADKAAGLARSGVEVAVVTDGNQTALQRAMSGVDAVYVSTSSRPELAEVEASYAQAALVEGAHVVKLSTMGAAPDSTLRFGRMHAESEESIENTGVTWTFLQPNGFMQNDLAWADQIPSGRIATPVADAQWSAVDARDIAGVAVVALLDPAAYSGMRIGITGPTALSPRERIVELAETLGRSLSVVALSTSAYTEQLLGFGVPHWQAAGLAELWDLYEAGYAVGISADTPAVLGRSTTSWGQFTRDYASVFAH